MRWDAVRTLHEEAVADVARAAERIPLEHWLAPRAEGKWSPAEVVEHLTLAYDVLLRELAGGAGMRLKVKFWQRVLLRFTVLPRILRRGDFPKGVRAPREIRPATANPDPAAALTTFREHAARFAAAVDAARSSGRRVRLTHPYFGHGGVEEALLLCARHLQHHRRQLPE